MNAHAIEFLQEWIDEKCCRAPSHPSRIEKQAETLAKECAAEAAEAGIPLEDLQDEVGDIQDLIAAKLEDAAEAEQEKSTASVVPLHRS
ncbi:hypothetical protein [Mesorhizobium sp. SP-1A]|uniref:hypothetical protein n=1 Tax=Mesorhizobium sp. SP-1A TaxID=3077840 RepID=UPI0028F6F148|nr:hypothetical protein [Mesorhizobium sp. SP-1A]